MATVSKGKPSDAARNRQLSHVDSRGQVKMVDVGEKEVTHREAIARGSIAIGPTALEAIQSGNVAKGEPLQAARLAGIMAAKRTSDLIPLCHPLPLSHVDVQLEPTECGYEITATVRTEARTGALMAVASAALTVYDMVKAIDREMVIGEIRLIQKTGGRSGSYRRSE